MFFAQSFQPTSSRSHSAGPTRLQCAISSFRASAMRAGSVATNRSSLVLLMRVPLREDGTDCGAGKLPQSPVRPQWEFRHPLRRWRCRLGGLGSLRNSDRRSLVWKRLRSDRESPRMTQDRAPPELELTGHIGRFIFQSDDQSYAVARFQPDGSTAEIVVAGLLHGIRENEPVLVRGAFIDHPRFGRQFKISSAELKLPSTARGIAHYLERGGVKGIGKALAKRLVDAFGDRTRER